MTETFICPCCDSEITIDEDGYLYVASSMSKRGVFSTHSGDPRFYMYDPLASTETCKQDPCSDTASISATSEKLDDSLVSQAVAKDLFNRGLLPQPLTNESANDND